MLTSLKEEISRDGPLPMLHIDGYMKLIRYVTGPITKLGYILFLYCSKNSRANSSSNAFVTLVVSNGLDFGM